MLWDCELTLHLTLLMSSQTCIHLSGFVNAFMNTSAHCLSDASYNNTMLG